MKYIYALLALVPIATALEFLAPEQYTWIFATSALALIPLAAVLGKATEELAIHTGPKIGGLLNATLGNAAELIITIVALQKGLVDLVKASITGSILGNILVVLGLSLLLGGLKNGTQRFNRAEAGIVSTLLLLSVVALSVPTFFSRTIVQDSGERGLQLLSDGVAIVMIVLYIAYLAYSVIFAGRPSTADATLAEHSPTEHPGAHGAGHHVAAWSVPRSATVLVISTIAVVFMSEFLVGAVEHVTKTLHWTEVFVGVMIIPLVGNVAEHIVGVQVAYKNQMDLSLGISLGSSLQVALFVAPALVFISLFVGQTPMTLVFTTFEMIALIGTVAVAAFVAQDGESNWLEGVMLLGVYIILGIAFFYL